jgi:hypothetical protein
MINGFRYFRQSKQCEQPHSWPFVPFAIKNELCRSLIREPAMGRR